LERRKVRHHHVAPASLALLGLPLLLLLPHVRQRERGGRRTTVVVLVVEISCARA